MPRARWSDPIQRAFFDAWIDESEMPDEVREQKIDTFAKKWGGLDVNAFRRALQEGNEADRLCAIFALGYLAQPSVKELLVPFLSSSVRKERWASAISLGEGKDERAFSLLQEMLLEKMEYYPPQGNRDLNRRAADAIREATSRFGHSANWDRLVDPILVKAWNENQAYVQEFEWYTVHRLTITSLFGAWGDVRAIPTLRQALSKCWEIEQLPLAQGGIPGGFFAETWHHLEDDIAYVLGQLEAWNALDGLELPPVGFQLARMHLVFGFLQVNLHSLFNGDITRLINVGTLDPDRTIYVLREHFGLTENECRHSLQQFQQWYQERAGKRVPL
jgi:hypothetical protein